MRFRQPQLFTRLIWPLIDQAGPTPSHRPELGPCWNWGGSTTQDGYATVRFLGRTRYVYRLLFERHMLPFPLGYESDHLCRNRGCVNPFHIEPVTKSENALRREAAKRVEVLV